MIIVNRMQVSWKAECKSIHRGPCLCMCACALYIYTYICICMTLFSRVSQCVLSVWNLYLCLLMLRGLLWEHMGKCSIPNYPKHVKTHTCMGSLTERKTCQSVWSVCQKCVCMMLRILSYVPTLFVLFLPCLYMHQTQFFIQSHNQIVALNALIHYDNAAYYVKLVGYPFSHWFERSVSLYFPHIVHTLTY